MRKQGVPATTELTADSQRRLREAAMVIARAATRVAVSRRLAERKRIVEARSAEKGADRL